MGESTSLDGAITAVEEAMEKHRLGDTDAPLSPQLLGNVHNELLQMRASDGYRPTYPRFILDWPDETGFVKQLTEIAHQYERAAKRKT